MMKKNINLLLKSISMLSLNIDNQSKENFLKETVEE